MSDSILVTGGNGFVGSHIVKELVKQNYKPIVLIRENSKISRLKKSKSINIIRVSEYLDRNIVKQLKIFKPTSLIHCAWSGVLGLDRNNNMQNKNLDITEKSIKLAKFLGCSKWTGLGSHAEYGNLNIKIDELSDCKPTTLYGKVKLETGKKSLNLCKSYGILGKWVRIFNTYGPNDNESWLIPYLIDHLLKNKTPKLTPCEQIWDYLHINDAVKAIILLNDSNKDGIYNLGSSSPRKLKKYIEIICSEIKGKKKLSFGERSYRKDQIMKLHPDISKIKKDLNWKPLIPFKKGIKNLISNYYEN